MDIAEKIANYIDSVGYANLQEVADEVPCSVHTVINVVAEDRRFWLDVNGDLHVTN